MLDDRSTGPSAVPEMIIVSRDVAFSPPPRLKITTWLSAPIRPIEPEAATLLRMSMFRRLEAVPVGGFASVVISMIAFSRHPQPEFLAWVVCELLVSSVRMAVVISIMRRAKRQSKPGLFGSWDTDLFIITGTLWSGVQGAGNMLTMRLDDPGLVLLVSFMCLVTIAAQCVRNPSSCRMNNVQMSLILLPFSLSVLSSPIPLVRWDVVFGPIYLLTMINLTRQTHEDYLAMIIAQIENRRHALLCALTGLPNRRSFDERLRDELARTSNGRGLSVLCIDLDGFKAVNDRFGHPGGDALLIQVSARLISAARPGDVIARFGGDEFAVLMPSSDQAAAEAFATRINRLISEPFLLDSDDSVTIGASIGIWSFDEDSGLVSIDSKTIIMQADHALYAAKHAGKGTFRRAGMRPSPRNTSEPVDMPELRRAG